MQIMKIGFKSNFKNIDTNSAPLKFNNSNIMSDTVSFGIGNKTALMSSKTSDLLAQVVAKLEQKNVNMSKGYENAVRNDAEVKAYYENTENLITHIRKLFSQTPDGKIYTFEKVDGEKVDGVALYDEFWVKSLEPKKNTYKYTGIHIVGDNAWLTNGETKALDSYCQHPQHMNINTTNSIEKFNKATQKCLKEILSGKNTQF